MIIVVDASVAVKWFVEENERDLARALLFSDRIRIAPALVLTEVANVLRKKLSLKEIQPEQAKAAINLLPDVFSDIVHTQETLDKAFEISCELNHPVMDCAYLACAIIRNAILVTADKAFEAKAKGYGYGHFIRLLGQDVSVVSSDIVSPAYADELVRLYEKVEQVFKHIDDKIRENSEGFTFISSEKFKPAFDSPNYHHLLKFADGLSIEERKDIVALCWFGRGYEGESFTRLRQNVDLSRVDKDTRYLISILNNFDRGLERLRHQLRTAEGNTNG